jgi:hypothetical protein
MKIQPFCILSLVVLTLGFLTPSLPVHAAGIVVNSLLDTSIPGDHLCTLREAMTNSNADADSSSGDCIAGSGKDTITFSISGTITLVTLLPNISSDMILDGTGQSIAISGNNALRMFDIIPGATVTIKDLTLTNGAGSNCGGAISNSGNLTLLDATISNNTNAYPGGAICNNLSLLITNSTLDNNTTTGSVDHQGGAIYNHNVATLTITNSTLSGNTTTGGGSSIVMQGGAIFNAGTLSITNSTLSANATDGSGSSDQGGAVYNAAGTLTITGSTFTNNQVKKAGGVGGGIVVDGGSCTITNSTFSGNRVPGLGGQFSLKTVLLWQLPTALFPGTALI